MNEFVTLHNKKTIKWWLDLAFHIASASKDPNTKVGAIVVDENDMIVSTGYNGFPKGCDDLKYNYCTRELKRERTIHAEINALLLASRRGEKLYCTLPICSQCMAAAIQCGIKYVYYPVNQEIDSHWLKSNKIAKILADECKINVVEVKCYQIPK